MSGSLVLAGATGTLTSAVAAASPATVRGVAYAVQDAGTHRLTVRGWAYDSRRPSRVIGVRIYADGRYVGRAVASRPRHRFVVTLGLHRTVRSLVATSRGAGTTYTRLGRSHAVRQVETDAGTRIVTVAKRYVGRARYVEGGASPRTGFDCSGYTKYVYAAAGAGALPHNAGAQSRLPGMRRVSAASARPGDLVFYRSGGGIFHVAIYAGRGMQYAAATPRDGVVYQRIWSTSVTYGHLS